MSQKLALSRAALPRLIILLGMVVSLLARSSPTFAGGSAPHRQASGWQPLLTIHHASGLALDPRSRPGRVRWAYTIDYLRNRVVKFDTGGKVLGSWVFTPWVGYVSPSGLAVGGSGNVFVADGAKGRVIKFSPSGAILATWNGFQMPNAVAVDRTGHVYVSELNGMRITKLSPAGQVLARWPVPWVNGASSGLPTGIAVDEQGNIFIAVHCLGAACPPPHGIQDAEVELDPDGAVRHSLLGGNPYTPRAPGEEPWVTLNGIAVDGQGNLYLATLLRGGGSLQPGIAVYQKGNVWRAGYLLPGQAGVTGLAVDATGTVYAVQNDRILKSDRLVAGRSNLSRALF